jgi:hypothetical protein
MGTNRKIKINIPIINVKEMEISDRQISRTNCFQFRAILALSWTCNTLWCVCVGDVRSVFDNNFDTKSDESGIKFVAMVDLYFFMEMACVRLNILPGRVVLHVSRELPRLTDA